MNHGQSTINTHDSGENTYYHTKFVLNIKSSVKPGLHSAFEKVKSAIILLSTCIYNKHEHAP